MRCVHREKCPALGSTADGSQAKGAGRSSRLGLRCAWLGHSLVVRSPDQNARGLNDESSVRLAER